MTAAASTLSLALAAPVVALVAAQELPPPAATSDRGIAGAIEVESDGLPLRARPEQTLDAPLLVRVARSERDGTGRVRSRIEFIGTVEGQFDLRPLLEHVDGAPADDLAPIVVRILSTLPDEVGSDLYGGTSTEPLRRNWYRALMVLFGVAWLSVPVIVLVRRRLRRVVGPPPEPPPPRPTLADQLRPLARAAIEGTLGTRGQGQLELLLYAHWRERLGLDGMPQAEAVATLRRHPDAGGLLVAVERWLHDASSERAERPGDEIERLLTPYRDAAPIDPAAVGAGEAAP